jgi:hypothetical protein
MTTPRAARIESVVQVAILLFMGVMAGAASFVHIHDVTVSHGQPSWIGWTNAIVIELMSIVAGLDIRRRKRTHQPPGFVLTVLLTAIGISLAAQVAQAHPSIWGWTVAALPALGLLAVVKIVMSRTTIPTPDHTAPSPQHPALADRPVETTSTGRHNATQSVLETAAARPDRSAGQTQPAGSPGPATAHDTPADHRTQSGAGRRSDTAGDTVQSGPQSRQRSHPVRTTTPGPHRGRQGSHPTASSPSRLEPERLDDVLAIGHAAANTLQQQQIPLTRAALTAAIRDAGHTIGTDKATALLRGSAAGVGDI